MKDLKTIKNDLREIQKSFNPEKSTYKVFDELIKHDYTSKEMISVLSKIRGIHKYPDFLKTKFLDVINNLNILKEHEEREIIAKKKEEERLKQQANTRELKDIIDNLEKAQSLKKEETKKKSDDQSNSSLKPVSEIKKEVKEEIKDDIKKPQEKSDEFLKELNKNDIVSRVKNVPSDASDKLKDIYAADDDGKLLFIILILLVFISIVGIGLFVLMY